jgi:superfamily II DNA or RNA helicase
MQLRAYQEDVIAKVDECKRPLIVAPTGSGKTVIASAIIQRHPNKHVLFLAHRRELIHQPVNTLKTCGVQAGYILAGMDANHMAQVQVASIQTLTSRYIRGDRDLPHADIVFIDEAHHARARTYQTVIDAYPEAKVIGMTATPCRRDGRGLGNVFTDLVLAPSIKELIAQGHLVGTRVFSWDVDLKGVRTSKGDYVESELEARMNTDKLVGDIISHHQRLARGRKTVLFASGVEHSVHLAREFQAAGVRAEHLDGSTPIEERESILARLSNGDLEVVCNCMVLTEGWDQPDVSCLVLARPTKSLGLYLQMAGRCLRPSPDKKDALILDHSGATLRHGRVEDPRVWYLDEDSKAVSPMQDARNSGAGPQHLECSQCNAIRTAGRPCPECGFLPKRPGSYHAISEGELVEHRRDGSLVPQFYSETRKLEFYSMLVHIGRERGHKDGAAAHRFKERFGHWPSKNNVTPIRPDSEVIAWDRHCRIKYAKSMQKEARRA